MSATKWSTRPIIETALDGKAGFDDGDWIEAPYITSKGIRLIQTGNVGVGEFLDKPEHRRFVSEQTFKTLGCKWVHPGDILICRLADPIGRACQVPPHVGDSITAVDCTIYRPDPAKTDARFALHWFNSAWHLKAAQDVAGGSTRQRISRGHLGRLGLPNPPLPEQRQIAAILDTIDNAIRKTEQIIAKLKQVKQGLLHDLLTRGIDSNGELRDPERHPEQFKDSPLGRIPRGWEVTLLGSLLEAIQQGWSPDCASTPATWGKWGVLKTTAVQWVGFSSDANKALPPHLAPRPDIEVHEGDVLMTRAGPASRVGVVSFVNRTQPKLMLSDKLYRLVPSAALHPRFLALALGGELSQRHLSSMKAGLAETQENISHAIVRALRLLHPPLEEQRLISAQAVRCDEREVQEVALLAKLCLLKQGLTEDLLTGRVRVTKLLENPGP